MRSAGASSTHSESTHRLQGPASTGAAGSGVSLPQPAAAASRLSASSSPPTLPTTPCCCRPRSSCIDAAGSLARGRLNGVISRENLYRLYGVDVEVLRVDGRTLARLRRGGQLRRSPPKCPRARRSTCRQTSRHSMSGSRLRPLQRAAGGHSEPPRPSEAPGAGGGALSPDIGARGRSMIECWRQVKLPPRPVAP